MFKNIQWLFFDMGSTLIDERLCYEHQFREIALAAKEDYETIYQKAVEIFKQNKQGNKELAKCYELKLKWYTEDEVPYDEAAYCLKELHSKYKIGIIANQNVGSEARLEQCGLLQYIDLVIASAEEGVAKPDKKIFQIALDRSRCEPSQAIMIGDRVDNDIIPAKSVGMKTIWIRQGFGRFWDIQSEDEVADMAVDNLTEMLEVLY